MEETEEKLTKIKEHKTEKIEEQIENLTEKLIIEEELIKNLIIEEDLTIEDNFLFKFKFKFNKFNKFNLIFNTYK